MPLVPYHPMNGTCNLSQINLTGAFMETKKETRRSRI
ncbi:hypothetical protein J2750_000769 [Methanococcoides alaskense]|uniref:Uncharacterized protein n=1 Tax=Methanococcoides alaskense TaxID=325778 RepID=A0AA90TZC2_9EURY|nr:hypothetical protein [Methanococcoides alaskense]